MQALETERKRMGIRGFPSAGLTGQRLIVEVVGDFGRIDVIDGVEGAAGVGVFHGFTLGGSQEQVDGHLADADGGLGDCAAEETGKIS